MPPSLSKLDRLILEATATDHKRGKTTTLTTLEISLDEMDGKRTGSKAIATAAWELARIGLLGQVKPKVTITDAGLQVVGAKPAETPAPGPEAVPVPELEPVKPVQRKAPVIPPALTFPPRVGETGLNVARRLLAAHPEGVTTAQANQWTGLKLGSRFSELIACGDAVGSAGRPAVYRLTSNADDARPDVAPATDARPEAGPATAEPVSAVVEVAHWSFIPCDEQGVTGDYWRNRYIEMLTRTRAANQLLIGVVPHERVRQALIEIGCTHSTVEQSADLFFPTTTAQLAVDCIKGLGSSIDSMIMGLLDALGLTMPEKVQALSRPPDERTEAILERVKGLATALASWPVTSAEAVRAAKRAERLDFAKAVCAAMSKEGRTVDDVGADFARTLVLEWVEKDAQAYTTANTERWADLDAFRGFVGDVAEMIGLADVDRSENPYRTGPTVLGKLREIMEDEESLQGTAARHFAIALADALGMNIEDTDPSRAVATMLDEVRRRKPVSRLIAEAKERIFAARESQLHALDLTADILGAA